MRLVKSPWLPVFQEVVRVASTDLLVAAPFITVGPIRQLAALLRRPPPAVKVLTNFQVESLASGSTDPAALDGLWNGLPSMTVWHLAGLHAKVIVADDTCAVVTSANLTDGGLQRNYEYGVLLEEPDAVAQVREDLESYADLGVLVPRADLSALGELAAELKAQRDRVLAGGGGKQRLAAITRSWTRATDTLLELRARPGESTNAIFERTIRYLLRGRSLTTAQLHPLIRRIHPDLCDDTIDRVINGVRFGRRWKHMVRNAQQALKQRSLIRQDPMGAWYLVEG